MTITSPTILAVLSGHHGGVRALSVSPDGRRLASGSHDCTIRLWCLVTRTTVMVLPVRHTAPVITLAFSPDGNNLLNNLLQHPTEHKTGLSPTYLPAGHNLTRNPPYTKII